MLFPNVFWVLDNKFVDLRSFVLLANRDELEGGVALPEIHLTVERGQ